MITMIKIVLTNSILKVFYKYFKTIKESLFSLYLFYLSGLPETDVHFYTCFP